MASRPKNPRSQNKGRNSNILAQFGIQDIPDLESDNIDSDVEDDDLEDELLALLSGKSSARTKRPKKVVDIDVEKMASECMRDISIDEDNLSDEEDLINELQTITGESEEEIDSVPEDNNTLSPPQDFVVTLLSERLNMYIDAETAAKECKDSSKVRRYGRAIKTLQNQLHSAKSGYDINEEEIPPVVTIPKSKTDNLTPASPEISKEPVVSLPQDTPFMPSTEVPAVSTSTVPSKQLITTQISSTASQLVERRNQYKKAALNAKRCGDTETALLYIKIAKKFDAVIDAESQGQAIDLSDCPEPPPKYLIVQQLTNNLPSQQNLEANSTNVSFENMEKAALEAASEPPDPSLFDAPPAPTTILEALQQRLQKFCGTRDAAKAEGSSSKLRRLQRIVKQYEDAIKFHLQGKPVDYDALPTPPGFGPIPVHSASSEPVPTQTKSSPQIATTVTQPKSLEKLPQEIPKATQGPSPSGRNPKIQRANTSSILEKQLQFLIERQTLFRQAALESKKNGDVQQAKEYLRMSKGFDSMIEATKNGLPIDATTIPTPPQLESDYVIIDKSECFSSDLNQDADNLFPTLEKELQHQIKMCDRNKDHFLSLGDVSSASKFEKLSLESKKDLVAIQHLWRNGEPCPMFHYETRLFSLVQCNTELSDQDIEIAIERGINLPGKPEELDSYIKIEFPIPSDSPQRAKTHTIRDTNNPIFQEVFKFEINRKSRSQVRLFKRQPLKCEVWSKGGFFRGDTLLGTANVKLLDLETKCSIHNSFDLMDGRKACGGKLEIKVKIRDPLLVKQIEEVREKWLVIDGYSSNASVIKQ